MKNISNLENREHAAEKPVAGAENEKRVAGFKTWETQTYTAHQTLHKGKPRPGVLHKYVLPKIVGLANRVKLKGLHGRFST